MEGVPVVATHMTTTEERTQLLSAIQTFTQTEDTWGGGSGMQCYKHPWQSLWLFKLIISSFFPRLC